MAFFPTKDMVNEKHRNNSGFFGFFGFSYAFIIGGMVEMVKVN